MEIIEKQIEKVKEVPYGHWDKHYGQASRGVANTALGLGIAGTALGLWAANKNGGLNLFGNNNTQELQKELYDYAILDANTRYNDKDKLDKELFGIYKSQIDADFNLYKSQRDADDILAARISALETKQAVNEAIDPWRAKVLDMKINGVAANAQAAVNLEAERRCCADNKIVNYVNSTFYPVSVADVTTGTTATVREVFNPLCGCCTPCFN